MKINLGASRHWVKEGWAVLDHRIEKTEGLRISGDIARMSLPDETCDLVFLSHVIEHIPHIRMQSVFMELNRVLKPGGGIRILVPDLRRIATAYVTGDAAWFAEASAEDPTIRRDLGHGGSLVNFVVSPGQDTVLLDRTLSNFIAGYAHVYAYDFEMMKLILEHYGFRNVRQMGFSESHYEDFREPLHVVGMPAVWQTMNQEFYQRHGLVHRYHQGSYEINFKVTGFDKNPVCSLIVEAEKAQSFELAADNDMNGVRPDNYNRYALSLLEDAAFKARLDLVTAVSRRLDDPVFRDKLQTLLGTA